MTTEIKKPIILLGTGRCGSTALHKLLSFHPHVAWLSRLSNRFPNQPKYDYWLMRSFDLPLIGQLLKRQFNPSEGYFFWQRYAPGFRQPFRDLTAQDVTNREKKVICQVFAQILTDQRHRLLIKITGWPRIGYLKEIFPDAKFIHIVRDGRAVANSMLAVHFWDGWNGPERWRWNQLAPDQNRIWEATDKSFVALAGLEWVMMQDATVKAKSLLQPEELLEIRYEDFCADKFAITKQIAQFAELDWSQKFEQAVQSFPVESQNFKWKTDLTAEQQKILEDIEHKYLQYYGYLS
jgi:hypothetical protein